jgi:hypothetical protein
MGTRRKSRLVPLAGARSPLAWDMRLLGVRPAKACARDPPSPRRHGVISVPAWPSAGASWRPRKGASPRATKRRGDVGASPLRNAGLAKLVLCYQLATLPRRSTRC